MKLRRIEINKDSLNGLRKEIKRDTTIFPKEEAIVKDILKDIEENGDSALFSYMEKFDKVSLDSSNLEAKESEFEAAFEKIDKDLLETLEIAAKNIRVFHERQLRQSFVDVSKPGIMLGQKITPMARIGVYVPGGKAAYPSTVLMDAVPAKVAGVSEIIMVTPPSKDGKLNPAILVAARLAGVTKVLKIGGAQAIGALAYGTESVPKVDKIVGPGNIFVALAKKQVFGNVGLDSVAGPSEITVLCDETANPGFVAADMLSQAEHDEMAQSILVTTSESIADKVEKEISSFLNELPRREIMEASLSNNGIICICENTEDALEAVNIIAPEHLEIQTKDPMALLGGIRNAGAIFLGEYSCEPLGDYFAGPNHVLPTNGTARFFSPLSTDDFIKKSSIISYDRDAFIKASDHVIRFADTEGLYAHGNAIKVRKQEN